MVEKRQINAAERKVLMAEIKRREKDLSATLNWKARSQELSRKFWLTKNQLN